MFKLEEMSAHMDAIDLGGCSRLFCIAAEPCTTVMYRQRRQR